LKDINDSEEYPKQFENVTVVGILCIGETSSPTDPNSCLTAPLQTKTQEASVEGC
jgi:hypothetical protein